MESSRSGSATRRRTDQIYVRVTPEERQTLQALAAQSGLTVAAYLRQVGMGYEPRSLIDKQAVRSLGRLNADLGRVGGLLKLWLSRTERQGFAQHLNIPEAVDQLRQLQNQVRRALENL